jgi:NAD(P)-dependent dehydrogenase (short-subunit alcohol dehydrogenase family)
MSTEDRPLAGKVAIVTGAASGIGRAAAIALAAEGAMVALFDVDAEGLAETATAITGTGAKAMTTVVDLAALDTLDPAVDAVHERCGSIDVLVNCAGIRSPVPSLLDTTVEIWNRVFTINATAPFVLVKRVARHMIAAGRGGRIVLISSSSAFKATSSLAYSTSKLAVVQLARVAAAQLGPYGVNVNAIAPGVTRTPMVAGMGDEDDLQRAVSEGPLANLLQRVSEPEDVGAAVAFLCLPASRQITGQVIHTSAGLIV